MLPYMLGLAGQAQDLGVDQAQSSCVAPYPALHRALGREAAVGVAAPLQVRTQECGVLPASRQSGNLYSWSL